ncbi:GMP synthase, partial [Trichonephila clavata]
MLDWIHDTLLQVNTEGISPMRYGSIDKDIHVRDDVINSQNIKEEILSNTKPEHGYFVVPKDLLESLKRHVRSEVEKYVDKRVEEVKDEAVTYIINKVLNNMVGNEPLNELKIDKPKEIVQVDDDGLTQNQKVIKALFIGKTLIGKYKRKVYEVTVNNEGKFIYNGEKYNSPSTVGTRITGKSCNGWDFFKATNVPILGICYGQQLICHYFGAKVKESFKQEFGRTKIKILKESPIIKDTWDVNSEVDVLMNHADSVDTIPQGFTVIASGVINQTIAMIVNEQRKIYCTQFHPEVRPTTNGSKLLSNFLDIANCERDWTMKSFIEKQKEKIKNVVGEKKVIAAVSGGVDSSVAAALTHKAIGKQLSCIFIDTGLLRKNQTITMLKEIPINYVDKSNLFLSRLKGITDPEEKRKIIGNTFIEVFEEEAKKIGDVDFLMQGTIYSDVVESGHASDNTSTIKSHHNVGGLPEKMNLKLVEPLRYLFKDEVRLLGKEIGLSDEIIFQHPFPG